MTRQATDQLYIDIGYNTPEEYYVYTAEAESQQTCEASVSCDASVIAGGEIVMAYGDLPSFATIICTISHIHGADLFAFSNAQLAAEVSVIRDYNIASSSQFDIATDGRLFRDVTSDDFAVFTISSIADRSRAFDMETQAAFLLAADATVISTIEVEASLESTTNIVIDASVIREAVLFAPTFFVLDANAGIVKDAVAPIIAITFSNQTADAIRDFDCDTYSMSFASVDAERIREFDAEQFALFTPGLTVDVIKNSFAILDSVATMDVSAVKTTSTLSTVHPTFSIVITANYSVNAHSSLTATATITATATRQSRNVGTPTIVSGGQFSQLAVTTSASKFGTGSLLFSSVANRFYSVVDVVYTGTEYVGVTEDSKTVKSTDGVNWTVYSNNVSITPYKISYGNNRLFVIGSSNSTFCHSTDGITWTSVTLTGVSSIHKIVAKGSTYYAIFKLSNSDTISSSTNLTTWTSLQTWTAGTLSDINFETSTYVAVAGKYVYTSSSGTSWAYTLIANVAGNATAIAYNGTRWVVSGLSTGLYYSSNLTTWSLAPNTSNISSYYQPNLLYANNRFEYYSSSFSPTYGSSDGISWGQIPYSQKQYLVNKSSKQLQNRKGYLSYTDRNQWSTWKTIDFWINAGSNPTTGFPLIQILGHFDIEQRGWTLGILDAQNAYILLFVDSSSSVNLTSQAPSLEMPYGTWNHIRVSYNAGMLSIYGNGTRILNVAATISNVATDLRFGSNEDIYYGSHNNVYIDEVLITNDLLTDPSATTITVPTQPWTNTTNTSLLLHFNGNLDDDAIAPPRTLQFASQLTTFVNATATALATKGILEDAPVVAFLNALANSVQEAHATLDAVVSLDCTAEELPEEANADLIVVASIDLIQDRLRDGSADATATSAIVIDAAKTTDAQIQTDAVFSELVAVARISDFFVNCDVVATQSADAVKLTDTPVVLTAIADQTTQADVIAHGVANIISQADVLTQADKFVGYSADLTTSAAQTTQNDRVRYNAVDLTSEFAVQAVTTTEKYFDAEISALTNLTLDPTRIEQASADLTIVSTQVTEAIVAKVAEVNITADTAQTVSEDRIRDNNIQTDAIFSEMAVVARVADFFITGDVAATQTTQAVKLTDTTATLDSTATLTSDAERIQQGNADLTVIATVHAEGTTNITGEVLEVGEFTQVTIATKTANTGANLSATATLTADVNKTTDIAIVVSDFASLNAQAARTRAGSSSMTAFAFEMAVGSKSREIQANLVATTSLIGDGRLFYMDPFLTWKIPPETNTYIVVREQREYTIVYEERTYTIPRG